MNSLKNLARSAGLGRITYQVWHRPMGWMREKLSAGGPLEQRRTERGRQEMILAAARLPPPVVPAAPPFTLHLLTGRRFWYQTAFCLHTVSTQSRRPVHPVIHDDGSLGPAQTEELRRLFPAAQVVPIAETIAKLDAFLPRDRFPCLRSQWDRFSLLRKLTDVHVGDTGWKLFIDSDLLFFQRPALLLDWLDAPKKPLHATDVQNSYGYPLEMLATLAGRPVAERVNTGLCGLRSEDIEWERMEYWCRTLIERAGAHYFQEQALVALLLAGRDCVVAPITSYVTLPQPPEALECRAVMHHYVAESKRWYFQRNWRRVFADAMGSPAAPASRA